MEGFQFANKELLWLLGIIPITVLLFILAEINKKKALNRFGESNLLKQLTPDVSKNRPTFKFILICITLIIIIFAIARPQFGAKLQEVKRKGTEIIIALDVSNSMLAQDLAPNRLEKAKRAIIKMIEKLTDDKIGLIVFAGEANTQVPVTSDYSATKMFIESIQPDIITTQGTALGAAINLAASSFNPLNDKSKVLIIISDGENHEDDPIDAAKKAKEKNMIIHTIGIGLPQGAPIPVKGSSDFKKDNQGNVVISKLDEQILQQVAATTGGVYVRSNQSNVGLDAIYSEINKMEKSEVTAYAEYSDKFHYLIFAALFFIIFELFVLERKNKWIRAMRLFD